MSGVDVFEIIMKQFLLYSIIVIILIVGIIMGIIYIVKKNEEFQDDKYKTNEYYSD
jgi:hypothetical protein